MRFDDIAVVLGVDSDDDGVLDRFDGCVESANPDELDGDADGLGDTRCDPSPAACPSTPRTGCLPPAAGKSDIAIKDKDPNKKRA